MALSPKRKRFVEEYLVDFNGAQAAIRAGYSKKTARTQAERLLTKVDVKEAVAEGQARKREESELSQIRVLEEFATIALSNISDFLSFGPGGVILKNSQDISRHLLACVSEVSSCDTANGTQIKFKLHNKVDALNSVCKLLGFPTSATTPEDAAKLIAEVLRLAGNNR